ncbi:MAG: hypothetical protein PHN51_06985 [Candidatus Nanopelagicales bacterium]|nr:hypothetical protein [Candidatus Nanopelagicales bacterium]
MEFAFLAAYLAFAGLTLLWCRSVAWWVISIVTGITFAGAVMNLGVALGHNWNKTELQVLLLIGLAGPAAVAFLRRRAKNPWELKYQALAVLLPFALLVGFFFLVTVFWTKEPAYLHPVSFLMGHNQAEDNAKWLDFTSQFASGQPIWQAVPMGGPLAMVMVFVATAMGAVSRAAFGGYNQVAVAANTVVFGEYFMVILAPLVLAPLTQARLRLQGTGERIRIPAPFIWLAALVVAAANLVATGYGHLTFQFVVLVATLWAATFMSRVSVPRALLMTTLIMIVAMTVWFPLNVLAGILLLGTLVYLVRQARFAATRDYIGIFLWLFVAICTWQPLWSSVSFVVQGSAPTASGESAGGVGAVVASVSAGLADSTLFSASGGTDQTGPILAILACTAVLGASIFLSRQTGGQSTSLYIRLLPIIALAGMALLITVLDAWATGGGPHYGALKFTFMAAIVVTAVCTPFALLLIDTSSLVSMTPLRWAAIVTVFFLLVVDGLIPKAIAATRPEQWSPPNPSSNALSYWWPADVRNAETQSIATSPVGCVYLPNGAKVPSAILQSQASTPQQVYSCTRILAGLAGQDTHAQPLVDWLRREWLTNTPAWSDVYDGLSAMPASALDKPIILLDDYSNVIGLDSMRSLLQRYPKFAGKTPEELAVINQNQ